MKALFIFFCLFVPLIVALQESDQWVNLALNPRNVKLNMKHYPSESVSAYLQNNITFHLALKQNQQGIAKLEKYILEHLSNIESPLYGQYLTTQQISELVAPSHETINQVSDWLRSHQITQCDLLGDSIRCTESVDKVNRLFNVKMDLHYNKINRQLKFRSNQPYDLPHFLGDHIEFVDGISNALPLVMDHISRSYKGVSSRLNSDVDVGGFSLEVMTRLYNMSDSGADSNVSIGAIEYMSSMEHDGFSNKDLLNSQRGNGVPPNPITKDHVIGINFDFPDTESELDVQMMYWGASNATLWYEAYDGWMYGWAVDFFNREDAPEVASISYGWDETQQCDIIPCENTTSQQYVIRCNTEFMKLAAKGVTLVVASGDAGSPGRSNELCVSELGPYGWNNINPDFPAGSPWVLSVGATYMVTSNQTFNYETPICTQYSNYNITCSNGVGERGAYFNKTYWTTGGAFTHWDQTPVWQVNNVQTYLKSGVVFPQSKYFNAKGRAYPDVSAVGHNCIVNVRDGTGLGTWQYVDGTSCSAPVFAGIIAQLNYLQKQRGKPVLGFVNPLLYKMYADNPQTFNDVTEGTTQCTEFLCCAQEAGYCCTEDFGFQAAPGYDLVSGLGTPNVQQMIEYLYSY